MFSKIFTVQSSPTWRGIKKSVSSFSFKTVHTILCSLVSFKRGKTKSFLPFFHSILHIFLYLFHLKEAKQSLSPLFHSNEYTIYFSFGKRPNNFFFLRWQPYTCSARPSVHTRWIHVVFVKVRAKKNLTKSPKIPPNTGNVVFFAQNVSKVGGKLKQLTKVCAMHRLGPGYKNQFKFETEAGQTLSETHRKVGKYW